MNSEAPGLGAHVLLCGGARAAEWDPRWFNPQPAEGDLVLPMPCGGAMAFRPVDVPSGAGPLDDRALTLGQADTELGYSEYLHGAFLAAPFPMPGGRRTAVLPRQVCRDAGPVCGALGRHARIHRRRGGWRKP